MPPEHPQPSRPANGSGALLPFTDEEYSDRLSGLRDLMDLHGLDAVVLASPANVAYFAGYLPGPSVQPQGCVVTPTGCAVVTLARAATWPWRSGHAEAVVSADETPDGFWRAVAGIVGTGKAIGCEADHLTMVQAERLNSFLKVRRGMDVALATLTQRLVKSPAEIALIRQVAEVAALGAAVIRDAAKGGASRMDLAMAGREAMEREIARRFPDAGYEDTRAFVGPGSIGDGLLVTSCVPAIQGYMAPLGRTMGLGTPEPALINLWQAAGDMLALGRAALKPGATCEGIAATLDAGLQDRDLLRHRIGGYGHSCGILSHGTGREAGLDLRRDGETVLEEGMVIGLEVTLAIPEGHPGAGLCREQDCVLITADGAETLVGYPFGPTGNIL